MPVYLVSAENLAPRVNLACAASKARLAKRVNVARLVHQVKRVSAASRGLPVNRSRVTRG